MAFEMKEYVGFRPTKEELKQAGVIKKEVKPVVKKAAQKRTVKK